MDSPSNVPPGDNAVALEFLTLLMFLLKKETSNIPSTTTTPRTSTVTSSTDHCEAMNQFLAMLDNGQDHGVEHIAALSDHLRRPFIVFHGPIDSHICGAMYRNWPPILLRYFPPNRQNPRGHYVPFGQDENWCVDSDNCLFHAVANQIKKPTDTAELKKRVIEMMKKDPSRYAELDVRTYNGECTLLLGGASRQFITSQRVLNIIPQLFPHYTRAYPPDSDSTGQFNAAYWHIVNRFYYSWVMIRMVGDRLRPALGLVEPFVEGGVFCQDRTSGQGRYIHASHIARARINPSINNSHRRVYQVLAELTSITENEQRDLNMSHLFGGDIDFFSEQLILQGGRRLDYFNYQDNFLEFVRDIGRRNEDAVIRIAAAAVIRDWSTIVIDERRIRDMLKILLDFISKESGLKLN